MTTRAELIREARRWIGTPYTPSGAHRGVGVNCVGFLCGAARDCGLDGLWSVFVPYEHIARPETRLSLRKALTEHLTKIDVQRAREGDLLLFDRGGGPTHLGMITEWNDRRQYLIHACDVEGKVFEFRLTWRPHMAFQIPGIE